jgi:hypothetical protein
MISNSLRSMVSVCAVSAALCAAGQFATVTYGMVRDAALGQASSTGEIRFKPEVATMSDDDQAILLAHELQHVLDFKSGRPYLCSDYEQRAVGAQVAVFRSLFPEDLSGPVSTVEFQSVLMSRSMPLGGLPPAGLIRLYWGANC